MPSRPGVVVFDVNETLSDMSPMARRFEDVGCPAHLARLWFATLLRDGFALAAAGAPASFRELAEGALRTLLAGADLDRDADDAVHHVLDGFDALALHPDVPEGVRSLREAGLRLVTLSNGSASVAERLLSQGGVREHFELLLSVEQAGAWKPSSVAYRYAAERCGVDVADLLLVAAHPWDTDGAGRAGAGSAWLNRSGAPYPTYFRPPDLVAPSLTDLAGQLG